MHSIIRITTIFIAYIALASALSSAQQVPLITFDEFFNFVSITAVKISPDGDSVLIGTRRADWDNNRFRRDIWIYREGRGAPVLLTNSGRDSSFEWSPDGRWIAFLSDRAAPNSNSDAEPAKQKQGTQLYLISLVGGESFPVTFGEESVGEFAWSPDSASLYFSTLQPWSAAKREQNKKEWKDVERFRESERGEVIARVGVADAMHTASEIVLKPTTDVATGSHSKEKDKGETADIPHAKVIATLPYSVGEIVVSADGKTLAITSKPPSGRIEDIGAYEIYLVSALGGEPRRLTRNHLSEGSLRWSADGRQLFFSVHGDIDAAYQQIQRRIYSIDIASSKIQRWAADSFGSLSYYDVDRDGSVLASVTRGTQVQFSRLQSSDKKLAPVTDWPGTYGDFSLAKKSSRVAFIYSSLKHPTEVYIADSLEKIGAAHAITSFNQSFNERALPKGVPYRWKADDGTEVEGMLIYPPGKFGDKHLRMLTLIHGGPAAADGDKFRADHYDWGILAATEGWLVFRPNYRGSSGYGDKFQRDISPQLLSRPGKDITEGIDALVRDGIADPDRLTIGGYSYGGYLTNWLITQTGRFRAAVSGAGAVEHAAVWGNDDLTFDDAWYLGGTPWEAQKNYNDQAALWQLNRVTTPTHIVAGGNDVRVPVLEAYLLERALHTLKVPSTLLIFPGEGHGLSKNPWHGKIKVREELKWLEKYCPAERSVR
jgi:dipeptidyl aminopeptidase/acylaminoacyl peptidase